MRFDEIEPVDGFPDPLRFTSLDLSPLLIAESEDFGFADGFDFASLAPGIESNRFEFLSSEDPFLLLVEAGGIVEDFSFVGGGAAIFLEVGALPGCLGGFSSLLPCFDFALSCLPFNSWDFVSEACDVATLVGVVLGGGAFVGAGFGGVVLEVGTSGAGPGLATGLPFALVPVVEAGLVPEPVLSSNFGFGL